MAIELNEQCRRTIINREEEIIEQWKQLHKLKERFATVFGEDDDDLARRRAREIEIDGALTAIPHEHRLAVARQLLLILNEHGILNGEIDDGEVHWRLVAKRLGVPYLELHPVVYAEVYGPEFVRGDLDEWLAWAREHAPERLAPPVVVAKPAAATKRKAK